MSCGLLNGSFYSFNLVFPCGAPRDALRRVRTWDLASSYFADRTVPPRLSAMLCLDLPFDHYEHYIDSTSRLGPRPPPSRAFDPRLLVLVAAVLVGCVHCAPFEFTRRPHQQWSWPCFSGSCFSRDKASAFDISTSRKWAAPHGQTQPQATAATHAVLVQDTNRTANISIHCVWNTTVAE